MQGLREFDNAKDLMEFYRQLRSRRARSWIQPRPAPVAAPPPAPPVARARAVATGGAAAHPFRDPTLRRIILAAASKLTIPAALACSHTRTRPAVLLRHAVMLLTRQVAGWSYPKIGRAFGGRDHTTILYGVRVIQRRMAADAALAHTIGTLLEQLRRQP